MKEEIAINIYEEKVFEKLLFFIEDKKIKGIEDEEDLLRTLDAELHTKRDIEDIWTELTDSEKLLVIRYPVAALKVNTARNIAISKTREKFGYNGLGDRSDAFRHGMWNAAMLIRIGESKTELFATAHEDKDTDGFESDGFSKVQHKEMDLHNNQVGRKIALANSKKNDDELSDIIYDDIHTLGTEFYWLHD